MSKTRVATPVATLSFPALTKAKLVNPNAPVEKHQYKYGCELIFGSDADLSAVKAAAQTAAAEKWGSDLPAEMRSPFRPGAVRAQKGHTGYEGEGVSFIGTKSPGKPTLAYLDAEGVIREFKDDPTEQLYPGCRVIANVTAYAYSMQGNEGVAFFINSVLKVGEGAKLGGLDLDSQFEGVDLGSLAADAAAHGADDTPF